MFKSSFLTTAMLHLKAAVAGPRNLSGITPKHVFDGQCSAGRFHDLMEGLLDNHGSSTTCLQPIASHARDQEQVSLRPEKGYEAGRVRIAVIVTSL